MPPPRKARCPWAQWSSAKTALWPAVEIAPLPIAIPPHTQKSSRFEQQRGRPGNHRLLGATVYVTVEPCAMCAGAMIQARIERLVYGCDDPKGGAASSCFTLFDHPALNHRVEVTAGVLAQECAGVLQSFFAARR